MKQKLFLTTILVNLLFTNSFAQNFEWIRATGGVSEDYSSSINIDDFGNVYSSGYFSQTVDFNPGVGINNLISNGDKDAYIQKLDANGNFLWVKSFGGISSDEVTSITNDEFGNIYLTGYFNDTVDFNPGLGVTNLMSNGNKDIFILKLDSNGNFIWAEAFGGSSFDVSKSICLDKSNNVIITGGKAGGISGFYDIFILKLTNNGIPLWSVSTGNFDHDLGYSITTDSNNNVYTVGQFYGPVDFDPGLGIYNLTSGGDIFIQKLDSNGNLEWAKQLTGPDFLPIGMSVVIDKFNNILIGGVFKGSIDVDPGVGIYNLTSTGLVYNSFILKLDTIGNFIWAKKIDTLFKSMISDSEGNIYINGVFSNSEDVDPGINVYNLTSNGNHDLFIEKLDVNGNFIWAHSIGGNLSEMSGSITLDVSGNIYMVGSFGDIVDFDFGIGLTNIMSNGSLDAFVLKLGSTVGIMELDDKLDFDIFPNPTSKKININTKLKIKEVIILDITGKMIMTTNQNTKSLSVADLPTGIYFIKIITDEKIITKKFVKQ